MGTGRGGPPPLFGSFAAEYTAKRLEFLFGPTSKSANLRGALIWVSGFYSTGAFVCPEYEPDVSDWRVVEDVVILWKKILKAKFADRSGISYKMQCGLPPLPSEKSTTKCNNDH